MVRTPMIFKAFTIKLYRDKGVRTHVLAKTLNVSTATVWKWIVTSRNGRKIGYNSYGNKLKSYRKKYDAAYIIPPRIRPKLKEVKITGQAERVRSYFQLLVRWINSSNPLDLDMVANGEEPPP